MNKTILNLLSSIEERISFNDLFTYITILLSKRSSCAKAKQAALIIKDNRIISIGYNGPPANSINCLDYKEKAEEICGKDSSGSCLHGIHAEQNAVAFAALNGISLKDSIIYVTQSPCINCAKLIISSGIKEVIYLKSYRLTEGKDFLQKHNIKITSLEDKL